MHVYTVLAQLNVHIAMSVSLHVGRAGTQNTGGLGNIGTLPPFTGEVYRPGHLVAWQSNWAGKPAMHCKQVGGLCGDELVFDRCTCATDTVARIIRA